MDMDTPPEYHVTPITNTVHPPLLPLSLSAQTLAPPRASTPPYFRRGHSNDETIHDFPLLPRKLYKKLALEVVMAKFQTYTNGDYIRGHINIQNNSTAPLAFKVFAVTFLGVITLSERNHRERQTFLHTIDLFASSYPEVDIDFGVHAAQDADGATIALPFTYSLLPKVRYRKYFTFKMPTQILDTFCPHGDPYHCALPPSSVEPGTLGVHYAIEAFLVMEDERIGTGPVVQAYGERRIKFIPTPSGTLTSQLPTTEAYLEGLERTAERLERWLGSNAPPQTRPGLSPKSLYSGSQPLSPRAVRAFAPLSPTYSSPESSVPLVPINLSAGEPSRPPLSPASLSNSTSSQHSLIGQLMGTLIRPRLSRKSLSYETPARAQSPESVPHCETPRPRTSPGPSYPLGALSKTFSSTQTLYSSSMLSSSILAVITLETHITVPRIRLDALLSGNFVIPLTLSVTGPLPLRSLTASFVSLSVESRHPIPITFDLGFLLNSGGKALSHAKRALGEICQRATGAGDEAFEQEVKAGLESILSLAITQRRYYKEAVSCQMEGEGSLRTVVVGGKMRARCGFPERMSASHQNCFVNQIYGIRLEAEFSRGMVAVHFPVEVR